MDLHERIMNIPVDKEQLECARYDARRAYPRGNLDSAINTAYRRGHRDACHAVDELVAREGLEDGRARAIARDYVSIERLRKMTLDELSVLVCEDASQHKEDKS